MRALEINFKDKNLKYNVLSKIYVNVACWHVENGKLEVTVYLEKNGTSGKIETYTHDMDTIISIDTVCFR